MEVDDILLVRTDPDSDKSTLSYIEKKWIEHIYGEIPLVGRDKVLKAPSSVDEEPDVVDVKSDENVKTDPPTLSGGTAVLSSSVVLGNNNYIRIAVLTVIFLALHLVRLPAKFDNISTRTIIFVAMAVVLFNII